MPSSHPKTIENVEIDAIPRLVDCSSDDDGDEEHTHAESNKIFKPSGSTHMFQVLSDVSWVMLKSAIFVDTCFVENIFNKDQKDVQIQQGGGMAW